MVRPQKRKRQWTGREEHAARVWMEEGALGRRQADDVAVVTAIVEISVGLDNFGSPVTTATIFPSAASSNPARATAASASAPATPAPTPAIAVPASSSAPGAAPTSQAVAPPSSGLSSPTGRLPPSSAPSSGLLPSSPISNGPLSSATSIPPVSSSVVFTDTASFQSAAPSSANIIPSTSLGGIIVPTDDAPGNSAGGSFPAPSSTFITAIPTAHRGNGTAPAPPPGTSPPVVAGAVVGSVGGTAVVLLVAVLLLRYLKHKGGSPRSSSRGESRQELHTSPAPIMAHKTARRSLLPLPPVQAWINRLSGSHKRGSSPTLPTDSPNSNSGGFQKLSGRKLPSQFGTLHDGPMSRDFLDPDAIQPAMSQYRHTGMTDGSHYSNDGQEFVGSTPARSSPRHIPIITNEPNVEKDRRNTAQFFDGPPIPRRSPARTPDSLTAVSAPAIPPLFAGARSTTPSPPDDLPTQQAHVREYDPSERTLMPSPARTPQVYINESYGMPPAASHSPNAPWVPHRIAPSSRSPPAQTEHDSWPAPRWQKPTG